jgi:hypothetical protein
MKAVFQKERECVYTVNFETNFSNEQIQEGILSLDWANAETNSFKNRYEIYDISYDNPISKINEYLISDIFKKDMIDILYQDSTFVKCWQIDANTMFTNTKTFAGIVLDRPGYTTDYHLDNRRIVITGMYYFINGDDPDQSTYFYTSDKKENELRINTGFNKGWIMGNVHNTWHRGFNCSNKDRYSILFGLTVFR